MVTSHGTIQGYNGQALVDSKHQVIIHGDVFGCGQDTDHLPPVLDGAKENLKALGYDDDYLQDKILTADTGYHSQTNLSRCEKEGLDAYIPDKKFRKRDPRFATQKRHQGRERKKFSLEDFRYDKNTDHYVCPGGSILRLKVKRWVSQGTIYKRYVAQEASCLSCALRGKCIWTSDGKRKHLMVPIGGEPTNLTKKMVTKIDSERGRKIYPLRIAIVEPIFAHIRTHKRLDRFTLRGKIKVTIQWLLYCMVHNMQKIANYGPAC